MRSFLQSAPRRLKARYHSNRREHSKAFGDIIGSNRGECILSRTEEEERRKHAEVDAPKGQPQPSEEIQEGVSDEEKWLKKSIALKLRKPSK